MTYEEVRAAFVDNYDVVHFGPVEAQVLLIQLHQEKSEVLDDIISRFESLIDDAGFGEERRCCFVHCGQQIGRR